MEASPLICSPLICIDLANFYMIETMIVNGLTFTYD